MIEEELSRLLERQWTDEERSMIKRIMDGLLYYKKLIPKALKNDVVSALQLCNRLKSQLEELLNSQATLSLECLGEDNQPNIEGNKNE